jgi:hypothetical protein
MSLWDNIRKKKERIKKGSGERMRKPGEKGAPTPDQIQRAQETNEDAPATNTGSIPNPAQTAMGPRFTTTNVMDRRKKKRPDVLKRFKQHIIDSDR